MGMEPDMVVQLVKDVHEKNIEINELAGDDAFCWVSEAAGLSSGNETIKRAIRLNRKRVKKSERAKTKQHKKRRINLKKKDHHPYDCIVQQVNLKSYNEAIACKAITRATALKAFKSNLKLSHLNLSVERMGLEGLKALLSEKTDRGHVRVTNCMKVIQKIFDFLTPES
ncbi:unnamed protein product [Mytilus coruscus]|uniref:PML C-terminal domain-containing protein n=1 Tax=Mytilus coruscus TaxID=42192 RepID=A0A6J8DZS5_MYTCO|nr:unnamed protein product [Mytilus coruscus]